MELLFEIILDLILEGSIEASLNKKIHKIRHQQIRVNLFIFYYCNTWSAYCWNIFLR